MSKPRLQPKGKGSLAGSLSTENVEELRSAHVRTLEAMGHLNRENTRLEAEVERLEKQTKGFERMKPEELDSLYVEERRLIESLERQNAELKAAAAGARGTRDAEVAKAKAECEQLRKQMEELRGHQRKAAQLAASQLEQIRTAYAQELADKASECEQLRTELEGLKLEMALERNRADGLERKLAELQSGSKLEDILAAEKAEMERTIAALRLELKSAVARADAAEDTALQSSERANASEEAANAARADLASAQAALRQQSAEVARLTAASEEEARRRKEMDAKWQAKHESLKATAHRTESELKREIVRLQTLLEEARATPTPAAQPVVHPPPQPKDEGRSVFTDFVGLKRELVSLREENERMRRTLSAGMPKAVSRADLSECENLPAVAPDGDGASLGRPPRSLLVETRKPQPNPRQSLLGEYGQPPPDITPPGRAQPQKQPVLAGSLAVGRRSAFTRQ